MTIVSILLRLLGRDRAWRLGRGLYTAARGEKPSNAIAGNGEAALVRRVFELAGPRRAVVFWDVGANCGEWSDCVLDASKAAAAPARLELFEPTPETVKLLAGRFAAREGVRLHTIALSDRDGVAHFAVVSATGGTNSLELSSVEQRSEVVEVTVARGADYAAAIGASRIDLLKIDTEGHDFAVLQGFAPLFAAQAIGIAQFEYNSRWIAAHRGLRDVFALAAEHGYALGRVDAQGIELFDRWNPECDRYFEDNYALVSRAWRSAAFIRSCSWSVSNTLRPQAAEPVTDRVDR